MTRKSRKAVAAFALSEDDLEPEIKLKAINQIYTIDFTQKGRTEILTHYRGSTKPCYIYIWRFVGVSTVHNTCTRKHIQTQSLNKEEEHNKITDLKLNKKKLSRAPLNLKR